MCNKNCKCSGNWKSCCKADNCCDGYVEESKYLFAKEMFQHYKELYGVALNELKFKSMNIQHLLQMLEEVVVLLWNKRPPMVIAKVIDNGIERYNIDTAIHNSLIADWQYNFADISWDIEECLDEEEDDHQENMEDFHDDVYRYQTDNNIPEWLFDRITDVVLNYINENKKDDEEEEQV